MPASSQVTEIEEDEDVAEEEPVDELYCNLKTNVVGIQYYKGMLRDLYFPGAFSISCQDWWARAKK